MNSYAVGALGELLGAITVVLTLAYLARRWRGGVTLVLTSAILLGLLALHKLASPEHMQAWMNPLQEDVLSQLGELPGFRLRIPVRDILNNTSYQGVGSKAVPGLRYHLAEYPTRPVPEFESPDPIRSIVAYHDRGFPRMLRQLVSTPDYHIVATLSDWDAVTGEWEPTAPDEALHACAELTTLLGPRADPLDFVYGRAYPPWHLERLESLGRPSDSRLQEAWRTNLDEVMDPPAIRSHEDGWTVDMWIVEHARTTRYECQLATGIEGLSPALTMTDSVRWAGTPQWRSR